VKGHKRFRSGAWRLVVAAGNDPLTGERRSVYETVHAPDNRAGAKAADARLAELIVAVESGDRPVSQNETTAVPKVEELASAWQRAHRPRPARGSGDWLGWSPKTARTVADNFRFHILPAIGARRADRVTGLDLDDLYEQLDEGKGLSPDVIVRCHGQIRAMFNWAIRKKLVAANPALAADPPVIKPRQLKVPDMSQVRAVQEITSADFAMFLQLAATVGARRGTLLGLRWVGVDLERRTITFSRSIAQSVEGTVEKAPKPIAPTRCRWGNRPLPCSATITVERRSVRLPPAFPSAAIPSSSPTMPAPATGAFRGPHMPGSATPSGPASPGFVFTTSATPRPAKCSWAGCRSRSSPSGSAAPRATSCATTAISSRDRTRTPPSSWIAY
jgi:hypothetical protein